MGKEEKGGEGKERFDQHFEGFGEGVKNGGCMDSIYRVGTVNITEEGMKKKKFTARKDGW